MARIKYTALVESIRGSIAGTTFQRNAFGYTVKAKPNIVNPNTVKQTFQKQYFQRAQQEWLNLTTAQRDAWNTYAATYPTPSKNNPDAYLSGYNLFTRWHAIAYSIGRNTLTNPAGAQGTVTFNSYELIRSGAILESVIDGSVTNGPWDVLYYLTRPLKATQNYQKSWTRFIDYDTDNTNPITVDLANNYQLVFDTLPAVGDYIGLDITFLNQTNAQVIYIPTFTTTVIA